MQRDFTSQPDELEQVAFNLVSRVLFVHANVSITFDEDLVGNRARDNHVKTLSSCKADKERNMAEEVADALLHAVMCVRLWCREEGAEVGASATMERMMENYKHISLLSLIITADRGYYPNVIYEAVTSVVRT